MGSGIYFFAGSSDSVELNRAIDDIGLIKVPYRLDTKVHESADQGPFCYLSFLPVDQLHPYGKPPVKVSDATDPLLQFMQAYVDREGLVAGRIYWPDDNSETATLTKPYYQKVARWIRKNWSKGEEGYYFGPEAAQMRGKGVKFHYLKPGVKIKS